MGSLILSLVVFIGVDFDLPFSIVDAIAEHGLKSAHIVRFKSDFSESKDSHPGDVTVVKFTQQTRETKERRGETLIHVEGTFELVRELRGKAPDMGHRSAKMASFSVAKGIEPNACRVRPLLLAKSREGCLFLALGASANVIDCRFLGPVEISSTEEIKRLIAHAQKTQEAFKLHVASELDLEEWEREFHGDKKTARRTAIEKDFLSGDAVAICQGMALLRCYGLLEKKHVVMAIEHLPKKYLEEFIEKWKDLLDADSAMKALDAVDRSSRVVLVESLRKHLAIPERRRFAQMLAPSQ